MIEPYTEIECKNRPQAMMGEFDDTSFVSRGPD